MANNWEEACAAMQNVIPVCGQYNREGIDVAFPNRRGRFGHVRTARDVRSVFGKTETTGALPMGEILCHILRPYLLNLLEAEGEHQRPLNVVVIIGGMPTDESPYYQIENVIERTALTMQKMNAPSAQVGVHFFQMGYEPEVADMLRKLDDKSTNGTFVRDIVDSNTCNTYDGDLTREAIFNAIESRNNRLKKGKGKS